MNQHISGKKAEVASEENGTARGFRLLDRAGAPGGVTVRDDQHEYAWLLDAVRLARRRGRRFRLIDSGKRDASLLEGLAASGADLYTADDVRSVVSDLVRLRRAGRSSGALVAFFHHGPLEEGADGAGLGPEALGELLHNGIDIHLSNRKKARAVDVLRLLALSRRAGESALVYYHHGPLGTEVAVLAEAGGWVHIKDSAVDLEADSARIADLGRASRSARGGLVLHLEKATDERLLQDFRRAGVRILMTFSAGFSETETPLPPRAYYLDTTFMP